MRIEKLDNQELIEEELKKIQIQSDLLEKQGLKPIQIPDEQELKEIVT